MAMCAAHAGSDNTRAGLVAAFGALSDLSITDNATYNEVADKVALSVNRIRNNALWLRRTPRFYWTSCS